MSTPATEQQEAVFAEARALGLSHTQVAMKYQDENKRLREALIDIRDNNYNAEFFSAIAREALEGVK